MSAPSRVSKEDFMKSLRFAFLALAVLGATVAVSTGRSESIVVASQGGSPIPPHTGGGR